VSVAAIGIICKAPQPGRSKTRLAAAIGEVVASELSACFLRGVAEQALLRLTFHCEPCKKILKLIEFDRIVHRRGVFGMFINDTGISRGDEFAVTEQRFVGIPYAACERIRWFLRRHGGRGAALDLIHALGLPAAVFRGCSQSC
jgi:hypothetical protein